MSPVIEEPEVVRYMMFRAEREDTPCDLSAAFFKSLLARGVRKFFGITTDQSGTVLSDVQNPEALEAFRNQE